MVIFQLRRGDTLGVTNGAGADIKAPAGGVWITQPGDARDYVLGRGRAARIRARGTALLYAFRESTVEVCNAQFAVFAVWRRGELPEDVVPAGRTLCAALRQALA